MGCTYGLLKRRKFTKVGHLDMTSVKPKALTESQKAVIRNNWHVLNSQLANVGVFTFIGMFETRPELKTVFAEFKDKQVHDLQYTGLLRKHALRVMNTLDKCISRLDQPSSMIPALQKIGVHHKQYNVPIEYLEIILPHFLTAIRPHIEAYWCADLEQSWAAMFDMILYHIKEGMQQPSEMNSNRNEGTVA